VADSTRPVREPTERSYTVYVCPECRKQSHPHDGTCSKDVRPGQFRPAHMYEVVPLEVVPVSEVERLRLRVDELELHVPCAECIQEREDAEAEAERLREALEDAVDYLRLGSVWIDDADRHDKLKRACERARCSLAALGPAGTTGATNPSA
jgi:hypothetical protein